MFMITYVYIERHYDLSLINFYAVTKRATKRDNKINSMKTCEKTLSKPKGHIWLLEICLNELSSNA